MVRKYIQSPYDGRISRDTRQGVRSILVKGRNILLDNSSLQVKSSIYFSSHKLSEKWSQLRFTLHCSSFEGKFPDHAVNFEVGL